MIKIPEHLVMAKPALCANKCGKQTNTHSAFQTIHWTQTLVAELFANRPLVQTLTFTLPSDWPVWFIFRCLIKFELAPFVVLLMLHFIDPFVWALCKVIIAKRYVSRQLHVCSLENTCCCLQSSVAVHQVRSNKGRKDFSSQFLWILLCQKK